MREVAVLYNSLLSLRHCLCRQTIKKLYTRRLLIFIFGGGNLHTVGTVGPWEGGGAPASAASPFVGPRVP